MASGNIISGGIEDIIFEGRNKAYGAYDIRKKYIGYVQKGMAIAIGIALLIILIPLITQFLSKRINLDGPEKIESTATLTEPPPTTNTPPPPEIKIPVPESIKFVPPKIVETVKHEEEIHTVEEVKASTNVGTTDVKGDAIVNTEPIKDIAPPEKPEEPLTFVEQQPGYPDGDEALYAFIQKNIHYPAQAMEFNIQGKVYVQFVVEKDGKITSPTIKKDIGGGCGDEAIRVVKMLPNWKPGKQNGRAVRVYVVLPIKFQLK
jgi:protein TonB